MEDEVNRVVTLLRGLPQDYQIVIAILVVLVVTFAVLIIINVLFGRKRVVPPGGDFDAVSRLRGRVERMDQNLNEFRTDMLRAVEFFKVEFEYVRAGIEELRQMPQRPAGGAAGEDPTHLTSPAASAAAITAHPAPNEGSVMSRQASRGTSEDALSQITPSTAGWKPTDFGKHTPPGAWRINEKDREVEAVLDRRFEAPSEAKPETLGVRLQKTRVGLLEKLKAVFKGKPKLDQNALEELETQLVFADLGVNTVTSLVEDLKKDVEAGQGATEDLLYTKLRQRLVSILSDGANGGGIEFEKPADGPMVVLLLGVNGSGKTTTAAKLAQLWKEQGHKVMLAAADTFRAAAVEQLSVWAEKIGIRVVRGADDAKPATVVYDAVGQAKQGGYDILIIDTAGRLQNKSSLMQELEGIVNVIKKLQPSAPQHTLLVIDGSTGQNGLTQAREFNAAVPLTGLIITKLDGTAKGGIVVAIKNDLNVPVKFIGVGESRHDLRAFTAVDFVEALLERSNPVAEGKILDDRGGRKRKHTSWNI